MQLIAETVKKWDYFSKVSLCILAIIVLLFNDSSAQSVKQQQKTTSQTRQRIKINEGWRFMRYTMQPDNLIYDERPQVTDRNDNVVADTKPTEAAIAGTSEKVLKKWILPTANEFISDPSLLMTADRNIINADGADISFITVQVAGKNRRLVPYAKNKVGFTIEGPGHIVATDNGDPASLISFASKERAAYFGLALIVVAAEKNRPGTIKITATSPGLKSSTLEIKSR